MAMIDLTLRVYRGERAQLFFTMTPGVDVSSWAVVLTVAANLDQTTKLLQVTATIIDGPNGVMRADLTAAQTTGLLVGHYAFDLWRTNVGSEELLAIGAFFVEPNVRVPV